LFRKLRNGLDRRTRQRRRFGGVRGGRGGVGGRGDGGDGFSWLKRELVLLMEKELEFARERGREEMDER